MFAYWRDRVFLVCIALYALNRLVIKPYVAPPGSLFQNQFNDLLVAPCILPPLLWLYRRLGLRDHDRPPTWAELGLHLCIWCLYFELIAPMLFNLGVADWRDAVAYITGGIAAKLIWQRVYSS